MVITKYFILVHTLYNKSYQLSYKVSKILNYELKN